MSLRLFPAHGALATFLVTAPALAMPIQAQHAAAPAVRPVAPDLRALVARQAAVHGVPAPLAHAVVTLESRYRPHIVHRGNYGLMQIRFGTARALGYRGAPAGLLNAETNVRFGMKYLARGWKASGGDVCRTIAHYQTGRIVDTIPASSQAYCARARRLIAAR